MNRTGKISIVLGLALLALGTFAGLAHGSEKGKPVETKSGYRQVDTFSAGDFGWVKRSLKKAPAFKSEKARYTIWVLGEGRDAAMVMVWDESAGTGSGYDTLYIDRNFNGDLTEEGEMMRKPVPAQTGKRAPMVAFDVKGIKDTSGKSYRLLMQMQNGKYHWKSGFYTSWPNPANAKRPHTYKVGLLPGNLQIKYANTLAEAPIYRLGGGAAMVLPTKRIVEKRKKRYVTLKPGEHYGTFEAGRQASVSLVISQYGADLNTQLRFYHSKVGGRLPSIMLRVFKDVQFKEDIAFTGGCG